MEGVHHSRPTRDPIHKHMEPSGKQFRVAGITLHRVQDGKIAEGWHFDNTLQYALETGALVHAPAAKK